MVRSSNEVVHSSRFNLAISLLHDRRSYKAHICIVATKGKMMGFEHISWPYSIYIMSSFLMCYYVCHELNTLRCMLDSGLGLE